MHLKDPVYPSAERGTNKKQRQLKAIETRWNGRLFRSRLEARWGVHCDTIALKYQYEPEGFQLPSGECYLPDFFFPEIGWYAEVKPVSGKPSKVHQFVEAGGGPCLLLDGEPGFRSYTGFELANIDGVPEVIHNEYSLDIWTNRKAFTDEHRLWCNPSFEALWTNVSSVEDLFSLRYRAGVEAALSARFGS